MIILLRSLNQVESLTVALKFPAKQLQLRRRQDKLRKRLVKHTPVVDVDDPDLPLPSMTVEKAPPTLPIAQSVPSPVPESTTASEKLK